MSLELMIGVNVVFGIAVAGLWMKCLRTPKTEQPVRKAGRRWEETSIDSNSVPIFKPSWRSDPE